jgi:hypothetical protein
MLLHGKCHCGNIAFSLTWDPDPVEIPARACDCSFCTRHGAAWTSNPDGSLTVTVREPSLVNRYAFGTNTADFHVCARCGVVPIVTCRTEGKLYAVVNVNTLDDIDPTMLHHRPASFSEEDVASKLSRRQNNWIADVTFVEGVAS